MVSTRPSPAPAKGRVAYPSASNYVAGDQDQSPTLLDPEDPKTDDINNDTDGDRVQGLKLWWKSFRDRTEPETSNTRAVFGVPLSQSIKYASVQISTAGQDGSLYVWGVIPVVVAKCGLYLKENGTEVEGAFRISGSTKRMKDLQAIFDTGPKYGKSIDWKSLPYTTHDVATIFRRFLTQMPEPIIPFEYYEEFRESFTPEQPREETIDRYKELIRSLPPVNQYLLLYVLDLLHVFANNAEKNLMTAPNLALIFQPGCLSHPVHVMRPRDHVLSQQVLEFLIDNQDHFLIGMQGKPRKAASSKASTRASTKAASSLKSKHDEPPEPLRMTKAEEDYMLPSDSDDEAPDGGYYLVETARADQIPSIEAVSTLPQSNGTHEPAAENLSPSSESAPPADTTAAPAISEPASTPAPAPTPATAPKPTPASASKPAPAAAPPRAAPIASKPQQPRITENMAPSDSDDDAPPGGYEVRTLDPAEAKAALIARASSRKHRFGVGPFPSSANVAPSETTSVRRRRTLPSGRVAKTKNRRLSRPMKEAP